MIFAVYDVAVLVLLAAELAGCLAVRAPKTPRLAPAVWIAGIVAAYAAQIAIAWSSARHEPWPLPVVRWNDGSVVPLSLLVLGALQSYALLALYRSAVATRAIACGAAALALLSIAAPVVTSADLYAYVANGVLGVHAYAPTAGSLRGQFAPIALLWGNPVAPATYGPLWLVVAHAVTSAVPRLAAALVAFRVLGAVLLGAVVLLLRAYGAPARLIALAALDPALHVQFVLNGHNDLLPLALVLTAAVAARRRPALAGALVAAAALVKLPFAIAGLPVLARAPSRTARAAAATIALGGTALLSWLCGGRPYLHALVAYADRAPTQTLWHAAAIAAALILIGAALVGRRRLRSAVWIVPMLGAYVAPWYAIWSLPYALASRRVAAYLLLALPVVSILAEPSLVRLWTFAVLVPLLVVLSLHVPKRQRFWAAAR